MDRAAAVALLDRMRRAQNEFDVLVGDGDRIAALTDGRATIAGAEHHWSTVGLYDTAGPHVAACWLLPLDPTAFDAIWTT